MGEARRRGTFKQRRAAALAKRVPTVVDNEIAKVEAPREQGFGPARPMNFVGVLAAMSAMAVKNDRR